MNNLWIVNKVLKKNWVTRAYFVNNKLGEILLDIREKIILNDFAHRFDDILRQYSSEKIPEGTITKDAPIWIFWGQGEEKMPPLVHSCYRSVLKYAEEHPVHLVTMKNYQQYVDIPDYIIQKLKAESITWATFSDIMRVSLLSKWGGIWLDATIYMTQPFPERMYQNSFFTVGHPAVYGMVRLEPSRCKWRMFLMGSIPDHFMMRCWRDLFYEYEREFDYLIDYFLVDYLLRLMKVNNLVVDQILSQVTQQPMIIYDLQNKLNDEYSEEKYTALSQASFFYKMSYRGDFKMHTKDGKDTFYKALFSKHD